MSKPAYLVYAERAAAAGSRLERRKWVKAMLVAAWQDMPPDDRQTFVDRLCAGSLEFVPLPKSGDSQIANVMWQVRAMIDWFEGKDREFLERIARMGPTWSPNKDTTRRYLLDLFRRWKRKLAEAQGEPEVPEEVTE